jgi:hypothetical protein
VLLFEEGFSAAGGNYSAGMQGILLFSLPLPAANTACLKVTAKA